MPINVTSTAPLGFGGNKHAGQSTAEPSLVRTFLGRADAVLASQGKLLGVGWRDKRGGIALMTALLGTVLVGAAALAVDVSIWEANEASMLGAADQAALAAGMAKSAGSATWDREAKGVAAAYGFVDGAGGVSVAVSTTPATGNGALPANAITVVITQPSKMFLSGVLLASAPLASATAVVAPAPASTCVVSLASKGGIQGEGNGLVNASTCNIRVNGAGSCDVQLSGNLSVKGYDIFLGEQTQNGCHGSSQLVPTDRLTLGAGAAVDPYSTRAMPVPTTPCIKVPNQASVTLNPGVYCQLELSGSQTAYLNPGMYIFTGHVHVFSQSQLTGTNVTVVLAGGLCGDGLQVLGQATVNLTAPTYDQAAPNAPNVGIAIWVDNVAAPDIQIDEHTNVSITGVVYAPGSDVKWSNNVSSPCTQLIVSTVDFNLSSTGNASFQLNCPANLRIAEVGNGGGYKISK